MKNIIILIIIANILFKFLPKLIKENSMQQRNEQNKAFKKQLMSDIFGKKQAKNDTQQIGFNPDNVYETEFDMTKKQTDRHKQSNRSASTKRNEINSRIKYSDPSWVKDEDTWIKGE